MRWVAMPENVNWNQKTATFSINQGHHSWRNSLKQRQSTAGCNGSDVTQNKDDTSNWKRTKSMQFEDANKAP